MEHEAMRSESDADCIRNMLLTIWVILVPVVC